MTPHELANLRRCELGLSQAALAQKLKTTRVTIARYENGSRRIPAPFELLVRQLCRRDELPLAGTVAAGKPIEPIERQETIDVPVSMAGDAGNFVLRVEGESMREDGILPGDLVVVHKQQSARPGDRVVAVVNGEATIKRYYPRSNSLELRPMNKDMNPIIVKEPDDLSIRGVVVGLIRHYR